MKTATPFPVHYRLVQGGGLFLALLGTLLLLGCVLLAWLLALRQAQHTGAAIWLAMVLAYAAAWVFSMRALRALPTGWLLWTGKAWRLQPDRPRSNQLQTDPEALQASLGERQSARLVPEWPAYHSCTLVLDMQHAVLLRLHDGKGLPLSGREKPASCWVWVTRAADAQHWHALRCALVWAQTLHGRADKGLSRMPEVAP